MLTNNCEATDSTSHANHNENIDENIDENNANSNGKRSLSVDDQLTDFPSLQSIMLRERRNSTNSIVANSSGISSGNSRLEIERDNTINTNDLMDHMIDSLHIGGGSVAHLIIKGLPKDMTEREFLNMFCFAVGFETGYLYEDELSGGGGRAPECLTQSTFSPTMTPSFISVGMPNIWAANSGCNSHSASSSLSSNYSSVYGQSTPSPSPPPPPPPLHSFHQQSVLVGVARFSSKLQAMTAKDHLQGRLIDPVNLHYLSVEINLQPDMLFVDPRNNSSSSSINPALLMRRHSAYVYNNTQYYHPSYHHRQNNNRYQQLLLYTSTNSNNHQTIPLTNHHHHHHASPPINNKLSFKNENPPCNTLYVGNLPPMATEEELRILFTPCIGFKRLSFRHKPNGPMCFVEFEDISFATAAMELLYGTMLSCSNKGGIRLSYSKNPLGVRSTIGMNNNNSSSGVKGLAFNSASVVQQQSQSTLAAYL